MSIPTRFTALLLSALVSQAAEPAVLRTIVHFEPDRAEIQRAEAGSLDRVAAYLLAHPAARIEIQGHTDPFGTEEFKLALGARYAEAVQAWLVARGVPATQLKTTSFGKQKPLYVGLERRKALRNARCEFRLL